MDERRLSEASILKIAVHGYSYRLLPGEQCVFMDILSSKGSTPLSAFHLIRADQKT
jgi:hypothetical protein